MYAHNADSADEFHFYKQGIDTNIGCYNIGDASTPCSSTMLVSLGRGQKVDVRYKTPAQPFLRSLSTFSGVRLDFGLLGGYDQVAFQAGPDNAILTNLGNAYANGVFTSPKKAVYYFTFSVPTTESNLLDSGNFSFFVNGNNAQVGCSRPSARREACTAALIKVLNPGETVTVKSVGTGAGLFEGTVPSLTYFQGVLLRQATAEDGTSFDVTSRGAASSNDIIWNTPILATRDSTWYTEQVFKAPSQGTYFFSFYIQTDTAAGEIRFTHKGTTLGIGCYDDGPVRRVCRANTILSLAKGDSVGTRSTAAPVAAQSNGTLTISQFLAFQIDQANPATGKVEGACLVRYKQYAPNLKNVPVTVQTSHKLCQAHCASTTGCAHFSWNTQDQNCHLQGKLVQEFRAHYVISGPASCPTYPVNGAMTAVRKLDSEPVQANAVQKFSASPQHTSVSASLPFSLQSMVIIGGICSLLLAGTFGFYFRQNAETRLSGFRAAGQDDVYLDSDGSTEANAFPKVLTFSRLAAITAVLVLVGVIAFASVKSGTIAGKVDAKATISKFSSGTSAADFFQSDDFASRLSEATMRIGKVPQSESRELKARLDGAFKNEFRNAVTQYRQDATPAEVRLLQMQLPPGKQDLVNVLLNRMFDDRTQQLGGRILQSIASRADGETDLATHQRILEEHGPMIRQYAKEMFPDGLRVDGETGPVYDQEDGVLGLSDRRLLPIAARNRIGPVRSNVVVGTGVAGIGLNIVELILTALNLASGPGFEVHFPRWSIGLLSSLSASLAITSCVVQFWDREKGIVNATFHPAVMRDFGFELGLQMPGWLKCALFSGISGLVTLITFVVDAIHAGIGGQ